MKGLCFKASMTRVLATKLSPPRRELILINGVKTKLQECRGLLYRHIVAVLIVGRVAFAWVKNFAFPLIG